MVLINGGGKKGGGGFKTKMIVGVWLRKGRKKGKTGFFETPPPVNAGERFVGEVCFCGCGGEGGARERGFGRAEHFF